MVLGGEPPGRVGRRRIFSRGWEAYCAPPSFSFCARVSFLFDGGVMNRRSGGDQSRGRGAGKPSSGRSGSGKPGGPRKGTGKPPAARSSSGKSGGRSSSTGKPPARTGSGRPTSSRAGSGKPPSRAGAASGKPSSARSSSGKPPARSGSGAPRARAAGAPSSGRAGSGKPPARTASGKPPARSSSGKPPARSASGKPPARSGSGKPAGPRSGGPARVRSGTIGTSHRKRPAPAAPEFRDTSAPAAKTASDRSSLRVVRGKPGPAAKGKSSAGRSSGDNAPKRARRRPRRPVSVRAEILRHSGARGDRRFQAMAEASQAYDEGRERDAVRMLRPLVKAMPGSPSVRELLGLSLYRSGQYAAAAEQLEAYVSITGEVDQHPVLMDCARARRDDDRVDELWRELAEVSPGAALVTEGRIVLAGSLADRGRLKEAVELLSRRADTSP